MKLDDAIRDSDAVVVGRLHEIVFPNAPSGEGAEVWFEVLESLKGPLNPGSRVKVGSFAIARDYKNLLFLNRVKDDFFVPSGDFRVFSSGPYGRIQTGSLMDMIGGSVLDNWFFLQDVNASTYKFSPATRAELVQEERSEAERQASEAGTLVPTRPPVGYKKSYSQLSDVVEAGLHGAGQTMMMFAVVTAWSRRVAK